MPLFAYVYFMADDAERIRDVAPLHSAYWQRLALSHYAGGPFADRSGGLITFDASDETAAERAIEGDPFVLERLITWSWLKRWEAKFRDPAAGRSDPSSSHQAGRAPEVMTTIGPGP